MPKNPFPLVGHPTGLTVFVVGLDDPSNGRNCECHEVCGVVVDLDVVLRVRSVQVQIDGKETKALACYWVTDGVDLCRVGFLPKHCVSHSHLYEGKLIQVTELYKDSDSPAKRKKYHRNKGCCLGCLIDSVSTGDSKPVSKKRKMERNKDDDKTI
jgi:hypothetical protein